MGSISDAIFINHITCCLIDTFKYITVLYFSSFSKAPRSCVFCARFEKPSFYRDYQPMLPFNGLHPRDRVLVKMVGCSKLARRFEQSVFESIGKPIRVFKRH